MQALARKSRTWHQQSSAERMEAHHVTTVLTDTQQCSNLDLCCLLHHHTLLHPSSQLLYEGIVEQKPHEVCTNLAGLLVSVPCIGCT